MTYINDIMSYPIEIMQNGINSLEMVIVDIVLDDLNGINDDGVAFRRRKGKLNIEILQ